MACQGGDCTCSQTGKVVFSPNSTSSPIPPNTYIGGAPFPRPSIYSQELPPWPTIEEIRKAIRDELKKAGVI